MDADADRRGGPVIVRRGIAGGLDMKKRGLAPNDPLPAFGRLYRPFGRPGDELPARVVDLYEHAGALTACLTASVPAAPGPLQR